jgi:hypothetical protein
LAGTEVFGATGTSGQRRLRRRYVTVEKLSSGEGIFAGGEPFSEALNLMSGILP